MAMMGEKEEVEWVWSSKDEVEMSTTFVWSELPKDMQLKVLSCLPMRDFCRMRCASSEFRDVIRRREFRTMYDMEQSRLGSTQSCLDPSPVICYLESSYPMHLEWSAYDYDARKWKTMNRAFPSLRHTYLSQLSALRNCYSVSSVGGLLCLYFWNAPGHFYPRIALGSVSSWILVWHPFRNRWKQLPACKHRMSDKGPVFVHAFVSDDRARTYKVLVAHNIDEAVTGPNYYNEDTRVVTEIYDSATGVWTDGASYTLRFSEFQLIHSQEGLISRGVHCNGVVYFLTGGRTSFAQNALLYYDIESDQWHDESYTTLYPIFEWDGRLMSIMSQTVEPDDDQLLHAAPIRRFWFVERDPVTRRWEDTGIEIPWVKVLSKFWYVESLEIVASGNHLAFTGCTRDGSFRIAVYRRAENYWRLPPSGAFSDTIERFRVPGLVLHKPQLDWRP